LPDVERDVYFYKVEIEEPDEWKRAEVLRNLAALDGDSRILPLGNDNYAWANVDRIPRGRGSGRLRFFRDRRSNLPGYAVDYRVDELPIPEEAGLIEPTHVVLAGDGLIAAEYNHFAPRITTHFANFLRQKLGLDLRIGTYIQGEILDQLDRLTYIQSAEFSLLPTAELEQQIRNDGTLGEAAAALMRPEGSRRIFMRLSGEKGNTAWTNQLRDFAKRIVSVDDHSAKVCKLKGLDPVTGEIEPVDLLKQKLVRRVDITKPTARSRALDTRDAYDHIEECIAEVRRTDLPGAAVIF
jgi:hypothetical protein